MTRRDDMAKSPGPTDPRWGRSTPLLGRLAVDVSYAAPQAHGIINVAIH
jgi:hypothetical protein